MGKRSIDMVVENTADTTDKPELQMSMWTYIQLFSVEKEKVTEQSFIESTKPGKMLRIAGSHVPV